MNIGDIVEVRTWDDLMSTHAELMARLQGRSELCTKTAWDGEMVHTKFKVEEIYPTYFLGSIVGSDTDPVNVMNWIVKAEHIIL